ncbi:MAG: MarR family winged helix-turn-helix transcriptional regulator [Sphingomonadales bacterium]
MDRLQLEEFKDVSERCAAFRTRKAARVVTRIYDEALRPTELKITQFTLMVAIEVGAPESISELADTLGMERTTLTRNMSVLERNGLIDIQEDHHSRARKMIVTDKGLELLARAYPLWKEAQAKVEASVGEQGWDDARSTLSTLSALN